MSNFVNKMLNLVGFDSETEEYEDDMGTMVEDTYEEPVYNRFSERRSSKVVKIHNSNAQMRVVVVQPEDFDETPSIASHLKNNKPIVLNLESVDKNVARRIIDFLSGTVYALDGDIKKVSNGIFVIAPSNVDIMGMEEAQEYTKNSFGF